VTGHDITTALAKKIAKAVYCVGSYPDEVYGYQYLYMFVCNFLIRLMYSTQLKTTIMLCLRDLNTISGAFARRQLGKYNLIPYKFSILSSILYILSARNY
jgi:hypothetical protein